MRGKRFTHMAVAAVAVAAFGVACADDDGTNDDLIDNDGGTIDPLDDPLAPENTDPTAPEETTGG